MLQVLQTIGTIGTLAPAAQDAAAAVDLQTKARAAIDKLTAEAPENAELWAKLAAASLRAGLNSCAVRAARGALRLTAEQRAEALACDASAFAAGVKPPAGCLRQCVAVATLASSMRRHSERSDYMCCHRSVHLPAGQHTHGIHMLDRLRASVVFLDEVLASFGPAQPKCRDVDCRIAVMSKR